MNCTQHPEREAVGMCVGCGKPFCAECLVTVGGKNYCRDCVAELAGKQTEQTLPPQKSMFTAVLLAIFLGGLGIHRFYVGKTGTGLVYLLIDLLLGWLVVPLVVIGFCVIVDIVTICTGKFTDAYGRPLVR